MKRLAVLLATPALVCACTTLDTWQIDHVVADSVSTKQLEERMDRFLRSVQVDGEVKDWYTVNGYYVVVRTPFNLRTTFRTRIPYVVCSGERYTEAVAIEQSCRLLDPPVSAKQ
jgi:hypothetical protein